MVIKRVLSSNEICIKSANHISLYESRRNKNFHKINCIDSGGYQHIIAYGIDKRLHRYIMEQYLGRKLNSTEYVHHIDQNKTNNDISNLFLFPSNHIHQLYHGHIKKFSFIHPEDFMNKYGKQIEWLYSYEVLYDLYIVQKLSCNKISQLYCEICSRTVITKYLKKFGIYFLREPSVN